jgi:hypothetical protein
MFEVLCLMWPEDFAVLMLWTHDLTSFGLPSDQVRVADYQSARFSLDSAL